MNFSKIQVCPERLRRDLEEMGKFGEDPGGGLVRTALSGAELKARSWLKERMEEAGLEVREDGAANLIGRLGPTCGPADQPCVATGSHIDTVPHGGRFDGAAGICAGLEALRAIRESGLPVPSPLELLVFTDEEGRHFAGTFGSRAMLNLLTEGEIYQRKREGQPSLAQSLERMGKDPVKVGRACRLPGEFLAFLELHIEQGPQLDRLGVPIGIVEGITWLDRFRIEVAGRAEHAGTTPMPMRDDALVKAARIITDINGVLRSGGPGLVGTIGELQVLPGASNIIPGQVDMILDLRSMKSRPLQSMRKKIREIVHSAAGARLRKITSKGGVRTDRKIMKAIEISCRDRGVRWLRLGSGAGHDAMTFSQQGVPTGMIFIPCLEGKSHCPEEAIRLEDAAVGARILADTMMRLVHRARP